MPNFEVLTEGGNTLQIGDTWMNFAFVQKSTVTTTVRTESGDVAKEGGIVANTRAWELTVNGENPILVVTGDSSVVLIGREQLSTSQFRFYGWTGIASNNAAVASFVAYVFDRASVVGLQKYLIINDGTGKLVFDATCKYMKIVGVIDTQNGINSVAIPAGKAYGTILGGTGGKMVASAASHGSEVIWRTNVSVTRMAATIVGTAVQAVEKAFYTYVNYSSSIPTSIPPPGTYGNTNLLSPVVDLTGL